MEAGVLQKPPKNGKQPPVTTAPIRDGNGLVSGWIERLLVRQ
jgi:hypothetical protein